MEVKPEQTQQAPEQQQADPKPTDAKDEALSFVNEVLKRDFKTRDEAFKSLDSLNRMVGDNTIAGLRKDAEVLQKVVKVYAKSEGVEDAAARDLLLKELTEFEESIKSEQKSSPQTSSSPNTNSGMDDKLRSIELKLQERELIESHPEAAKVMTQLRDLTKVYTDKDLKEIYESTGLKDIASAVVEKEKIDAEKAKAPNSSVPSTPSARGADVTSDKMKTLVDAVRSRNQESDRVELVSEYLKQMYGEGGK